MRAPARFTVVAVALVAASIHPLAQMAESPPQQARPKPGVVTAERRLELLSRAKVWSPPSVPVSKASLAGDPRRPAELACKFKVSDVGGTSPKFDCVLDSGEEIRVKYGRTPEIPSEVAASRLLRALGFPADDVTLVERLRCYGCPAFPFRTMQAVDLTHTTTVYESLIDFNSHKEFEWVAVERKHPGRAIAAGELKGWGFYELEKVDAKKGGAPRAHVDALRLLAVFLAHWDNKSENQRLVCVSRPRGTDSDCEKTLAMLQDVGSMFGPPKIDLEAWDRSAIWAERGSCTISMEEFPQSGGTFAAGTIVEGGRRLLASLLGQLSDRQLNELFTAARFDKLRTLLPSQQHAVSDWVRVFKRKVAEISDGPSCPQ